METMNPLLSKLRLPGRTFQLPSRGVFYKNGELADDVVDGELHVHPLPAITEISLKNPDLLFSGQAIDEVFATCVPGVKKPRELFGRDVDAIFYFIRLVTYGPEYVIQVKHTCENAKQHTHTVNLEPIAVGAKQLDPTQAERMYTVTLPNGQVVKIKPVRYSHLIKVLQGNIGKETFSVDDIKATVKGNLIELIAEIDGITERKLIEEWIATASSPLISRLTDALDKTNDWGPDSNVKLKCKDCGELMDVQLPIDPVSFFTG